MTKPGDKPEFLELWPTRILRHSLPGADQANPVLAEHILALDAAANRQPGGTRNACRDQGQ